MYQLLATYNTINPARWLISQVFFIDTEDFETAIEAGVNLANYLLPLLASDYTLRWIDISPPGEPFITPGHIFYVVELPGQRTLLGGHALDPATGLLVSLSAADSKVYSRVFRGMLFAEEAHNYIVNSTVIDELTTKISALFDNDDFVLCTRSGHRITFNGLDNKLHYKQRWRFPHRNVPLQER
jgi:hypothetical protein